MSKAPLSFLSRPSKFLAVLFLPGLLCAQTPAPSPSVLAVYALPTVVQLRAGTSGTTTVFVTRAPGFTGPIALSLSPEPGWSATFNPNPITGTTSTATITAPLQPASPFLQTLTAVASAAGNTKSSSILIPIIAPEPFPFSVFTSENLTIDRGIRILDTVTILRVNRFAGPVVLTASGLPEGVTASFNPNSTTGSQSGLTLTASVTAVLGSHPITITGAGGGPAHAALPSISRWWTRRPHLAVSLPFVHDGAGEFCFVTSSTVSYINSWNTQKVEVNGVPFTNLWSDRLPPRISGNYHIHYIATVPCAHLEVIGTP